MLNFGWQACASRVAFLLASPVGGQYWRLVEIAGIRRMMDQSSLSCLTKVNRVGSAHGSNDGTGEVKGARDLIPGHGGEGGPLSAGQRRLRALGWSSDAVQAELHRITEWSGLEGTSVGHLVQPPCRSRVACSRLEELLTLGGNQGRDPTGEVK